MESRSASIDVSEQHYEEEKGLLRSGSEASTDDGTHKSTPLVWESFVSQKGKKTRARVMWFHLGVVALYTVVFVSFWLSLKKRYAHGPNTVWTPARQSIVYGKSRFHIQNGGFAPELFGKPSAELDEAWEQILKPANSWFTKEEVAHFGGVSGDPVVLPDGTLMGGISVYHDLHCIKRLYRSLNKDHYFHNMTEEEEYLLHLHNMHCLDFLRKAAMCHGDTSPLVYKWDYNHPVPVGDMEYEHECVDWDSINKWAIQRMVDPYEPGAVVHPIFGPAYANFTEDTNHVGAVTASGHYHPPL